MQPTRSRSPEEVRIVSDRSKLIGGKNQRTVASDNVTAEQGMSIFFAGTLWTTSISDSAQCDDELMNFLSFRRCYTTRWPFLFLLVLASPLDHSFTFTRMAFGIFDFFFFFTFMEILRATTKASSLIWRSYEKSAHLRGAQTLWFLFWRFASSSQRYFHFRRDLRGTREHKITKTASTTRTNSQLPNERREE